MDTDTSLEEYVLQMAQDRPTGQVIHDEIGVSWEVIAATVYYCSRNDVKRYAPHLPREFYTVDESKATQVTLDIWEKAIVAYQKLLPHQEQRRDDVWKRWKKERPKYERALNFAARFRQPEYELEYIRHQTGDPDYLPGCGAEYDILDVAYDEIARSNKEILLERMEPVLKQLPIEQSQKLAAFYNGYASLAYIPLLACVSIMTEKGKQQLKEEIDNITANTKDQFYQATYHAKVLVDCYGIRQGNDVKLRGGWQSVWRDFERKTKSVIYLDALRMAVLLLVFPVSEFKDYELEMFMEYALFLDDSKRREMLGRAKELLAAGEIQAPHKQEEITPFISEMMGEQEILEQYFGLEIASTVYDQ